MFCVKQNLKAHKEQMENIHCLFTYNCYTNFSFAAILLYCCTWASEIYGYIISMIWLSCVLLLGFIKHPGKSLSTVIYCFGLCMELLVEALCVIGGQYMVFIFQRWSIMQKQIRDDSQEQRFSNLWTFPMKNAYFSLFTRK